MSEPTPGRWQLDPAASTVTFTHKGLWGLVTVSGVFTDLSGEGEVAADGTGTGTLTIGAASLNTKNAKRDKHLRSADFFDTEAYPTFTFTARSATRGANGTVQVAGDLSIRGTVRPLTFTARAAELSEDAVTLTGSVDVDRHWFGMTWNQLGGVRGPATVNLTARFRRDA
jgi:polyisoprenoid-binding protein YceI